MIPVYYDEEEEIWKKADSTNEAREYKWYDYCNKMWANSVTVSETNRESYKQAEPGTTIPMDDILTMQVWVPRYKYKVWNYNSDGTKTSDPQEIEIAFEEGTATTGEITCIDTISGTDGAKSESCKLNNVECTDSTCNNKWYTHPAFTFGEEEIKGFWIGKFELTGTIENITTKPNLTSIRSQTVSSFETNIMAMNDSGNIYDFSTSADTHMIKNMEWGAVAYLSHSKYGTCTDGSCSEVYINNCSNYITGIGADTADATSSSTTCTTAKNKYNGSSGVKASTTHNIYGVYDMSGGAYDYVMGNIVGPNGAMMSGHNTTNNSGYTGIIYDEENYTNYIGIYDYPDDKYIDKYSFGTSDTQIMRSKLGDAIKEVYNITEDENWHRGWYGNLSYIACSHRSWLIRGGSSRETDLGPGIFCSYRLGGNFVGSYSTRLIITP